MKNSDTNETLAIFGGRRAVSSPFAEKWKQIPKRAIDKVVRQMRLDINTSGRAPQVLDFERRFAELSETNHALLMNSGTATLHSAYLALGVGPGDEVIVPSYTFFASVAPILQCGARPVFCDINPRTLTADPDDVARRISPRTKAICVVHVWGNPAEMDRLKKLSDDVNVGLIEDCSHAHGAKFQGRPVGSWGNIGCFSLQGNKAVSGGEAGIAVTDDAELFDRMLAIGHFPRPASDQRTAAFDFGPYSLGLKYRPHLYAAILANESLSHLSELNRRRQRNLAVLKEELEDCDALRPIDCHPAAQQAGYLEFVFRYVPEKAGGWRVGTFCHAVCAEGVPMHLDRYEPLHQVSPFNGADFSSFGGAIRDVEVSCSDSLPITESVCPDLVAFPAFTDVPEKFLRECAAAIRKVVSVAGHVTDFRTGN